MELRIPLSRRLPFLPPSVEPYLFIIQQPPSPNPTIKFTAMSDTDDEIVPDSQMPTMDSSMLSMSNIPSIVLRIDSGKRRRATAELSDEDEDAGRTSQMSAIEHGTMDEHLSCGICLSLLENPFMVLPCMHSYDRECLAEWWKRYVAMSSLACLHSFMLT